MEIVEGFEWDDQKATSNLLKHRVSFTRAAFAFRDLFAVEIADTWQNYGEERTLLLGLERSELLAVIYTECDATIRIISARRADAHEQRYYQRQNAK